ncbi:Hypothetical protein Ccan_00920 [Capnocytophaga canimorsus Cc5]|uniref:Uncharacterized protein n=1 Tax=Capnocytophaga canimorsus (strain 5) TaxID=860228 RepID=F9YPW9_CAPCC|nr:Hypothetical protein Ccan_00920 [Capnocytophaga canimorsus Cc5]
MKTRDLLGKSRVFCFTRFILQKKVAISQGHIPQDALKK